MIDVRNPGEFVITTFGAHLPGAFLSCPGHFGNIRHDSVEDAEREVRHRFGDNVTIKRKAAR